MTTAITGKMAAGSCSSARRLMPSSGRLKNKTWDWNWMLVTWLGYALQCSMR